MLLNRSIGQSASRNTSQNQPFSLSHRKNAGACTYVSLLASITVDPLRIFRAWICALIVYKTASRLSSQSEARLRRTESFETLTSDFLIYKADRVSRMFTHVCASRTMPYQWCPLFIVKEGARSIRLPASLFGLRRGRRDHFCAQPQHRCAA
jgi:hypothetical protein